MAEAIKSAPAWRPAAFDENDPLNYRLAWLPRNDTGNAERLLNRFGRDLIYVRDVGWHWWDGRRWAYEPGEMMANRLAHETVKCVYDECTALQDAVGDKKVAADMVQDHFKWAMASGNARRVAAMIEIAQHYLMRRPSEMDSDPLLLNLANGSLHLSGACNTLRPHDREDLATKVIDIDFDPGAKCPLFIDFLETIIPDPAVRDFLQRSFGYALSGLTGEQVLWFFYGTGANGKSVLMNVMARIMGPYAMSLPFSSLTLDDRKRGSEASPDLARLPGSRMVRASEPEKGTRFGESTIKSVTGGEPLTVRHLNHGFFDFTPEFKLFLSGNHKPIIRGQDTGVWRRIRLVPFTVTIPEEKRDHHLEEKLWRERAGILNSMIEGFMHWDECGLAPPEAVLAATQEYREDSDRIGLFLSQWCERIAGASVQASDLYEAYQLFCKENADDPVSNTAFGRMLPERGIEKDKRGTVRYLELQLTEAADQELVAARRIKRRRKGEDES
ncbi:phage/plasmid primase, P4 family [Telmatospirillum sp.]|uniref:DNA primase family protein n=1 Tax=Telmatospirillum sp. TaxID=2079197 RepID=UPI00285094C9|nr:phage/plasmid primase, P4 family [Telmatospirillum sp.]MDR3438966.1 phage/plasmid primase, P4 family [Telmatospirillum sp.]